MMSGLNKRVLIADDDVDDQELLMEALLEQDASLNIETVNNGQQLLSYLTVCPEAELPGLIILDYKMPFLNAGEVLERLMPDVRYVSIPRVVWSSSSQPEHIEQCMKAGAVRYFTKPSSMREMEGMVVAMLEVAGWAVAVEAQSGSGR